MNYYKEIFLDYDITSNINEQIFDFSSSSDKRPSEDYSGMESISKKNPKRGFTYSFDYYIVHCITEINILNITITKTVNSNFSEKNSSINFLSKYKYIFKDPLINNEIFIYPSSKDSFIISLFFKNLEIKQLEFKTVCSDNQEPNQQGNLNKFIIYEGNFSMDSNHKTNCIDHILFDQKDNSDYFSIGSTNGNIYFLHISKKLNNSLQIQNIKEIKHDLPYNFREKITSFFLSKSPPVPVKHIKFLKDNLISYITEDKKFKIYNQFLNKEVLCLPLNLENINENIISCKIEFLDYDETRNFFIESKSKILFFCIYLEFTNNNHIVNIFELQFLNIPLTNEVSYQNNNLSNNIPLEDLDFRLVDYGTNIKLNINKLIKLKGKLIDMLTNKNKFWIISKKITESENSDDFLFSKYEIKIFNLFKLQFEENIPFKEIQNPHNPILDNNDIENLKSDRMSFFSHSNQEIILLDDKLKNFSLIMRQISFIKNLKTRNNFLFKHLNNSENIISNEHLIKFYNRLNLTNPTHRNLRSTEQKDLINRTSILKKIFSDKYYLDNIIPFIDNLIRESLSNEILSLGNIKNNNLDSICFLRENGISFLRFTWEFQKINEIISSHEVNLRNFIFEKKSISKFLNNPNSKDLLNLKNKIMNYTLAKNKISPDNSLFICLALLRIILTENYLNLSDYNYIIEYFINENHHVDYDMMIKDHFGEILQNENSLIFLDCINLIISNIFKNNYNVILNQMNDLLEKFENYKNEESMQKIISFIRKDNGDIQLNKNENKFNYKFCEIIKKMTQDKIQSLFYITRDLLSFTKWIEIYHKKEFSTNFSGIKFFIKKNIYLIFKNFCSDKKENIKEEEDLNKMDIDENKSEQEKLCISKYNSDILELKKKKLKILKLNDILAVFLNKTKLLFSQAYSVYILSNLSSSLMIPEKSAYEKLCIFIIEKEDDNNFNYLDLKLYDILNEYGSNILKIFNEDLIDYLIINIWSGFFLGSRKFSQNNFLEKINKKIIYKTFNSLIYFKENGLVNLLLKLYLPEKNLLESIFIKIICYARLENRQKFKEELNNYFTLLSNINIEYEKQTKKNFVEFYEIFTDSKSEISHDIPNLVLFGFYLLEDYLNKCSFLLGDLKQDFYYNIFIFIYPIIKESTGLSSEKNFYKMKIQKFIIDFLNTCLIIDFDLALSFYLCIIDEIHANSELNNHLINLFIEYIFDFLKKPKTKNNYSNLALDSIKSRVNDSNFSNNLLINKLILSDTRLLKSICNVLEKDCLEIKNNKKLNSYFSIQENILQETLGDYKLNFKMSLNIFYLLHKIYSDLHDFHNVARISLIYTESIDELIKNNVLTLEEMFRLFTEKNISLQNLIFALNKISSKNSSIYLLRNKILQSGNEVDNFITDKDFISISEIEKEKILTELRISVLEKLSELSKNNYNIEGNKEELQKLKTDNFLFNMLYKLNLQELILDYKIFFYLDEKICEKNIINLIRKNLIEDYSNINNYQEENDENKLNYTNKIFKSKTKTIHNEVFNDFQVYILKGSPNSIIFNSALKELFIQLIEKKNFNYIKVAIETILSICYTIDLPSDLMNEAVKLNAQTMFELMIKYKREKDLLNILRICEENKILINCYLFNIVRKYFFYFFSKAKKLSTGENKNLDVILKNLSK